MENVTAYLKKSELFSGLNPEELIQIASQFSKVVFKKNKTIFNEGDPGDKMFILTKGEATVSKKMGIGERELRRLQPGECFGEMALISNERRSATVRAVSDVECLEMHQSDFSSLLDKNRQLNQRVMHLLWDRIKYSEDLASQHILTAYQTLVFSLSTLADSRDPETGSHLNRVRNYCSLLSELLSHHPGFRDVISPSFIDNIYIVSPLHDIGKVGIPDNILLKPGRLTAEEFETMKSHTLIGAATIQKVLNSCHHQTFQLAFNVINYHHERYDGTGYPAHLHGEDIPLEARIMSLADVYDVLLSRRVYKEPFTYEKSRSIIQEGAGTQFDSVMAEVMLDNIKDFEKIHQQYAD